MECTSEQHNVFAEYYDKRLRVVASGPDWDDIRCTVCGFEYTQFHQRSVNVEVENVRNLAHVRSGADMRYMTG